MVWSTANLGLATTYEHGALSVPSAMLYNRNLDKVTLPKHYIASNMTLMHMISMKEVFNGSN